MKNSELKDATYPFLVRIDAIGKFEKFNILCDTGSPLSLISATHPLLESKRIWKSENRLKLRGAFANNTVSTDSFTRIQIAHAIDNEIHILGEKRFDIVDSAANFGIILGFPDIKDMKLFIGEMLMIERDGKMIEIEPILHAKTISLGMDAYKMINRIYCDYDFRKDKQYFCELNGNEYIMESSVLNIPIDVEIKEPLKFKECEIIKEDAKLCFKIEKCGHAKSAKFDLTKCQIGNHLTSEQQKRVRYVVSKYSEVFSISEYDLGKIQNAEYEVQLSTDTPQRCRSLKLSEKNKQIIHKELQHLEKADVIERDDTIQVVTSTFIPIQKSDGSVRLVSDFRSTNNIIKASNLDLPTIPEILSKVANYKFYSAMDVRKAYWSVMLKKNQRFHFTVTDPVTFATFKYKRLPMGVKTASAYFQRIAAHAVFRKIDPQFWTLYIDDNLLFDNDFENGMKNLEQALANMKESGLKLNFGKCSFMIDSIKIFGFIISESVHSKKLKY